MWFAIFHIGIDFWIFPNYFIDSNNPLDSFFPLLEVEKRDDMFDIRYAILRIASITAIFWGGSEFFKEPENLENLMSGSGEIWSEVYEWGQNKFMGVPDNSTAIQLKKSARQIYAEAFMEDEQNSMFGMGGKRFYDDEPQKPAEDKVVDDEYEVNIDDLDIELDVEKDFDIDDLLGDEEEDPLDRLTSNEEL